MSCFLDKLNISLDNLEVYSVKMRIVPYSKLQNPEHRFNYCRLCSSCI